MTFHHDYSSHLCILGLTSCLQEAVSCDKRHRLDIPLHNHHLRSRCKLKVSSGFIGYSISYAVLQHLSSHVVGMSWLPKANALPSIFHFPPFTVAFDSYSLQFIFERWFQIQFITYIIIWDAIQKNTSFDILRILISAAWSQLSSTLNLWLTNILWLHNNVGIVMTL